MSETEDNSLTIATDGLEVTLSGEIEEVESAYTALQELLQTCYAETIDARGESSNPSGGYETQPLHAQPGEPPAEAETEMSAAVRAVAPDDSDDRAAFVQLVLRRDKYTKVHLLERKELSNSFLGNALDPEAVSRIYTDSETEKRLRPTLEIGETLWRELTPEGRQAVERRSRDAMEDSEE